MKNRTLSKLTVSAVSLLAAASLALTACAGSSGAAAGTAQTESQSIETEAPETTEAVTQTEGTVETTEETETTAVSILSEEDITVNETINNEADGEHAIEVSDESASYSNIKVPLYNVSWSYWFAVLIFSNAS